MVANDISIDVGARATATADPVAKSMTDQSPQNVMESINTVPPSDERAVWLAILMDWIAKARKAGLPIEVYDMRPSERGIGVVILDACYHADCGKMSVGDVCGNCYHEVA